MSRFFCCRRSWPLLCTVTLAAIAACGSAAEPASATQQDDLKAIRTMLDRIDGRLAAQQSQLTDAMVLVNKLMSDLATMKDEHARMKQELADMRARPAGAPTTSYFGGPPTTSRFQSPPAPTAAPPAATVKLVNTYFTDMTAVINGVAHTLPPGTERILTVPPGPLNYQVFMVADIPQTRNLMPGEQLTLTLYPRR